MAALSLVLLLTAMALGAATLVRGQRRGRPPVAWGYVHATVALTAVAVLTGRVVTGPENLLLNSALVVLGLAATGGLFTLAVRRRDEPPVLALILLHATTGIIGAVLLLVGVLQGS